MGDDATSDARLICGFFTCDIRPFNPLLEALPRFMRIGRGASSGPDGVVEQFIRMASAEASERRAGTQSVLNKLSELMFIEAIRTYMDQLSGENTGWFSGLRDPLVGRALSLLHAQPARSWTLEELAEEFRCLAFGTRRSIYACDGISTHPISHPMAYATGG